MDYEHVKFKADGPGYAISLGLTFKLVDRFYIVNSIGYRVLNTGSLRTPDDDEVHKSALDFSGMFLQGAVSVSPWVR